MRPARPEDSSIGDRLRVADAREVAATTGRTPVDALREGIAASLPAYTAELHGDPCAVFGVVPTHAKPLAGAIWMLGTDELYAAKWSLLRQSAQWLEAASAGYDALYNVVDARNTLHIRWLRWLGFSFLALHPEYGIERRPFYEFAKICHV